MSSDSYVEIEEEDGAPGESEPLLCSNVASGSIKCAASGDNIPLSSIGVRRDPEGCSISSESVDLNP